MWNDSITQNELGEYATSSLDTEGQRDVELFKFGVSECLREIVAILEGFNLDVSRLLA